MLTTSCSTVVALLTLLLTTPLRGAEPPPYNLISIVTDDQAAWSIGAYGARQSRTPNMDRLAREGARFLNAFTCTPVCSPSRAAFLTGRFGTQVGITDWITPKEAKDGVGLAPESMTWPKLLRQRGYVTGILGKWHLGAKPEFHPSRLGFDHFMGSLAGSFKPLDPELEAGGKLTKMSGFGADIVIDDALAFLQTNRSKPFALLIHFREPHMPYGPVPEQDSLPFKDLDPDIPDYPDLKTNQVKNWTRDYYAAIHSVDRNMGRLLARLEELGLAERTIVMFTSDHGYMIGHHGLHSKGNANWVVGGTTAKRPNMFEESIRIPLIVRWPGVVKPGLEIAAPVSNIDTWASVLGMLGVQPPKEWKQEGLDFTPLLREQTTRTHEVIFGQYDLHNGAQARMRMIRTTDWKLVRHWLSTGKDELYDLKNDRSETNNRYGDPKVASIQSDLQKQLVAWMRSINDPLLDRIAQ